MANGTELARTQGAAITRRSVDGETELAPIVETNAIANAARAESLVKARVAVALGRPRDMATVRVKLLKECERPGFAKVARYVVPRGGKSITGPTIRFAESAKRIMGNLDVDVAVAFEDAARRILQVTVYDMETNNVESMPVVVDKVMERLTLKEGEEAIGSRLNSAGRPCFLVPVPESEMPVRQGAAVARVKRNLIMANLPGDIVEECMVEVVKTQAKQDAADPAAAAKEICDAFADLNVMPDGLKEYIGCDVSAATPAQLVELRGLYLAIKSGETTWAKVAKVIDKGDEATDTFKAELAKNAAKARAEAAKAEAAAKAAASGNQAPAAKPTERKSSASESKGAKVSDGREKPGPTKCARCGGADAGVEYDGAQWAHKPDDARCTKAPPLEGEPAHDPKTGEVKEQREPGSDDK